MVSFTPPSVAPESLGKMISSISHWDDGVWCFDISTPGVTDGGRKIRWAFNLPDGSLFTDPAWAELRQTVKCFLWSLRTDPPDGKRRVASGTLISVFSQVRVLVCWMAGEGLTRFAEFDADAATEFLAAVTARPGRRDTKLSVGALAGYLVTIGRLYAQRKKLEDGVPDDLAYFLDEYRPRNRRRDRALRGFPYTPDAVAVALIGGALRLIGRPAEDVLALRALASRAYDYRKRSARPIPSKEAEARHQLSGFAFSTLEGEDAPWHRPIYGFNEINALVGRIYDACFVVIAWLVGARVSEILGLEAGCIECHSGPDGEEIRYLHGRIYKMATGSGGRPHRWIAPEPVVRAIEILERLSAPTRKKLGSSQLWLLTRDPILLQQPSGIPNTSNVAMRLNGAFRDLVDLPLHKGKPWRFNTHQGRKTLARFIGKRDRTGLHALQEHLGHLTRDMTDIAYVGTDFELAELIGEETMKETRAALEDLLTADTLAGHAGRMIVQRSRFRGRTRDGELREYVDFILRDTGMVLGVCDWGYCLYRREYSACHGNDRGPNEIWRSQSVCVNCANFAVSERHRGVWEDRRRRNAALLEHPDLDGESRTLAERRILECDTILGGINGDLHDDS